ncbi:hypothetical protein M422DRAFT_151019, partial [Sphaerobolus stellatus SS14]
WSAQTNQLMEQVESSYERFTQEQQQIFHEFLQAIQEQTPLYVFMDGKAGRGKTFLIEAIVNYVCSIGKVAIVTATSAFAALLYPGGRTAHSTFKVPVQEDNEMLVAEVEFNSPHADLLREASVIVWDEAPMANRVVLECVDVLLRNICQRDLPFGGKIFACAGDFRQTCPVIRRGSRPQIVDASIRSSFLWPIFNIRRLTVPIRNASDPEFAEYVDSVGDGVGPEIPLPCLQKVFDVQGAIDFIYPLHVLMEPSACSRRSILAPTNKQVDTYNDTVLDLFEGEERVFYAGGSLKEAEETNLIPSGAALDYVTRHPPPGLASYALRVKVGGIYRLMRNLSNDKGLVKNTRCVVTAIGHRVISVRLLKHNVDGHQYEEQDILIPRITFQTILSSSRYTLIRKQFPLAPAYATTFNSCQELTLDRIVIDLTRPVFSHGQLYTAMSRVRHRDHAKLRLNPGDAEITNVTFVELLI